MAADELYWNIKVAAGEKVLALALPGIGQHVYGQLIPGDKSGYSFANQVVKDIIFPCVLLTSEGETDETTGGDSEGISGVFPQRCWIADVVDSGMHGKERIYLAARKTLMRAFDQQKLAGRPEVVSSFVVPEVIFDPRLPHYQFIVSGMVLRFNYGLPRYPK